MTGSKSVELIDREHCGCLKFTWLLKAVKQICGRRIYPGLLNEKKKKKVSLTQESPELSAAENVFWVNTVLMLFLYYLVKATTGKKQQARWTLGLDYRFI